MTQQLLGALSLGVAILALGAVLPFVASFLLDGTSYLRRRGSAVPLAIVGVAVLLIAGAGALLLVSGLHAAGGPSDTLVRSVRVGAVLLSSFAIPLAVLTAGIRQMVRRAHREDLRRAEADAIAERHRLERAVDVMEERVYAGVVTEIRSHRRAAG